MTSRPLIRLHRVIRRMLVRIRARLRQKESLVDWIRRVHSVQRAMVIVAHPDDEIFCGGLICQLSELNVPVTLLLLTRGEGASCASLLPAQLSDLRSEEVRASAAALGIREIKFLEYEDPPAEHGRRRAPWVDQRVLSDQIRDRVLKSRTDLVVTHGSEGEYGHPAHLVVHTGVKLALELLPGVRALGMNAWRSRFELPHLLNRIDCPEVFVDGRKFEQQRLRSLLSHESQRYIFEQWADGSAEDYVRRTQIEWYSFL